MRERIKMKPIQKNKLKNKYVEYIDKEMKHRVEKVIKIIGRTLTVKNTLGRRRRINLDLVKGCIHHKVHIRKIEEKVIVNA